MLCFVHFVLQFAYEGLVSFFLGFLVLLIECSEDQDTVFSESLCKHSVLFFLKISD